MTADEILALPEGTVLRDSVSGRSHSSWDIAVLIRAMREGLSSDDVEKFASRFSKEHNPMDKYEQLGDEAWAFVDKRAKELGIINSEGSTKGSVIFLGIYPRSGDMYHTWGYYHQIIERGFAQGCAIAEVLYGEGFREETTAGVPSPGVDVSEAPIDLSGVPRPNDHPTEREDSLHRAEGPSDG